MSQKKLELWVGLFVIAAMLAFAILAFSVSGLSLRGEGRSYTLYASFANVGGLKERSPVKLGGVVVGRVEEITLDVKNYTPRVRLAMFENKGFYPETSSLAILTSGLLGEQYIGIKPGFIDDDIGMLADGDRVEDTKSALVLEDLIGQFIYSINKE
ncbi:outer membrane lipid asymmetry maintenance protein MlaD [Psychromonas antarctica]|jgi:phospholipid/cholesterol/gamma-HCH transport system substrate-binding protein|uniref:outer membrane lipid asymmetry maintenance protein MlaD n=1 Tax=Psychromonas antarctica TaxID=67573 RepID=UPI001EE8C26E|nr:outer membrane lipid asymmetry maintenance protein MlaD [Psychromonas antarctica]MCG6199732.1 outer membrane lipid asymmetry maintenance protein MlaD [Psychromonas antarctica]